MNNGKHTPGPWSLDRVGVRVIDPRECGEYVLANVHGASCGEVAANARLISAAPDMLEALRSAVRFLDTPRNSSDEAELVEVMQAAIRKATGIKE